MSRFKSIALLSTSVLLAACGPEVYRDEQGRQTFAASCNNGIAYCYQQATETCPGQYKVIERLVIGSNTNESELSKYKEDDDWDDGWSDDSTTESSSSSSSSKKFELIFQCQ